MLKNQRDLCSPPFLLARKERCLRWLLSVDLKINIPKKIKKWRTMKTVYFEQPMSPATQFTMVQIFIKIAVIRLGGNAHKARSNAPYAHKPHGRTDTV